jgi:uncharacterized membrane protein YphA (DoxX/SURF4 family)
MNAAEKKPARALRQFIFRLGVSYTALYLLPFPLSLSPFPRSLPGVAGLETGYGRIWAKLVEWVGRAFFHLSQSVASNPYFLDGDSTFAHLRIALLFALAAMIALAWSLFDRTGRHDRAAGGVLRLGLRYYLAGMMMNYGLAKFGHRQFPSSFELPEYMVERYGDSSPMRLLWAFMGYSTGYRIFTGLMETLSGSLLLFRRTTTLGSLVGIAAMANVAMLDCFYDVGLKLFTCHLLIFMVVLAWPDRHRLANVLLYNRPAAPVPVTPPWSSRWRRISGTALKAAVIGGFIYLALAWDEPVRSVLKPAGGASDAIKLEGAFDVQAFVRNEIPIPAWTDPLRWQVVTFTPLFQTIGVHLTNGDKLFYHGVIDAAEGTLTLDKTGNTFKAANTPASRPMVFKYVHPSPDELTLDGLVGGAHLIIRLHRADLLLLRRGFHWISDDGPYNR